MHGYHCIICQFCSPKIWTSNCTCLVNQVVEEEKRKKGKRKLEQEMIRANSDFVSQRPLLFLVVFFIFILFCFCFMFLFFFFIYLLFLFCKSKVALVWLWFAVIFVGKWGSLFQMHFQNMNLHLISPFPPKNKIKPRTPPPHFTLTLCSVWKERKS